MIGSYGPGGSVTYRADPSAPGGYSQYTQLDPSQQAIYDRSNAAQIGALDTANAQLGRINTALGQSLTPPQLQEGYAQGAPIQTSFDRGAPIQTSFGTGPALQFGFNQGQAVQGNVGPTDFSADRDAVTQSEFDRARSRLDPMWQQAENQNRTRLSNQGLSQNSTAYKNSMGDFDRARNDAYDTALSSAIRAGSDQQQRMFDQAVAQGQFANNAAGQQYAQNMGAANFGNQAAGQQYAQNLGAADFSNQAAGQQFGQNQSAAGFNNTASAQQTGANADAANFTNAARQANFGNLAYSQNMPIQQFQALMGTGQLQMPTAYSGPTTGVSPADAMGAYSLYQQGQNANYQAQLANRSATNQALGGLVGAGLKAAPLILSDRRMKKAIQRIGERPDGLGLYTFRYKSEADSAPLRYGVMADEVAERYPHAVREIDGALHVNYAAL